jgi:hypothetical protein
MTSRSKALVAPLAVTLALAASAEAAFASPYTGRPRAREVPRLSWERCGGLPPTGPLPSPPNRANVYRRLPGGLQWIGSVRQALPMWDVYRGTARVGYVRPGTAGTWSIYRSTYVRIGDVRPGVNRYWVYRGTGSRATRVGYVATTFGVAAAGAGFLLLIDPGPVRTPR